jgi:hydroxymethylbilane synthase
LEARLIIRIATRKSKLALWQANHVSNLLKKLPEIEDVELLPLSTKGDQILDQNLQKIGGKGLFIKELEYAILQKKADIAVHSMKDLPVLLQEEFFIAAVLKRESPFDCLVSKKKLKLAELESGSLVGSSSLRRQSQILKLRPDLRVKNLRGNVNTRIDKLESGNYDAIILAKAGLDRLELSGEISQTFSTAEMVPAAAQGVIGIECLRQKEEIIDIVSKINDFETEVTTNCERSVNSALFADCHSPIGSYATYANGKCRLESIVISPDGSVEARDSVTGCANNAEELGLELADRLKQIGAIEILKLAR